MKLLLPIIAAALFAGCKLDPRSAHIAKATVLGIHVAPSGSGPSSPVFDLGLVRYQYLSVPQGIALTSHVDAKLGFKSQTAIEDVTVGLPAGVALTNSPAK